MSTTLNGTVNGTYDNYTAELVSPDRARKILSENPSEFKDMRLAMILTTSIREGTWKRDRHVVVYNPDGSIRSPARLKSKSSSQGRDGSRCDIRRGSHARRPSSEASAWLR